MVSMEDVIVHGGNKFLVYISNMELVCINCTNRPISETCSQHMEIVVDGGKIEVKL